MKLQKFPFLYRLFFLLNTLEGLAAFFSLFQVSSMERNAVLLGFSLPRLVLGAVTLCLALICLVFSCLTLWKPGWTSRLDDQLEQSLGKNDRLLPVTLLVGAGALGWTALLVVLNLPAGQTLGMVQAVYQRGPGLFIWLAAFLLQSLALILTRFWTQYHLASLKQPARAIHLARTLLIAGLVTGFVALAASIYFDLEQFYDFFNLFILACFLLSISLWLLERFGKKTAGVFLIAILVFILSFTIYRATTFLVERPNTPGKAYFDELADAWLHGQLYLDNPDQTHDLTLYQGHWYVANPPMVAVLLVPWVKMYGVAGVNTVVFSIIFGAINLALMYLLLELMAGRGWSRLSTSGNLWLSALLGFGTVHFYLSIVGKMWFMSQTVTVTFVLLAALAAVTNRPAWWVGAALGLGIVARPNIIMAWPLVFGITAQLQKDSLGRLDWRRLFQWTVLSGIPLVMAVGALLGYNLIRFGNLTDFGYMTENVADFMAGDLKAYGTFNPHFILRNLRVMFLSLPQWDPICSRLNPQQEGMSMFLATPAMVYLVRSFRKSPLVLGAWGALLLLVGLIANYYNTGAWQFGYKYMLDFAVPVIILLAVSAGRRVSWLLRILILLSIIINTIGVWWWFGRWCVY